MPQAGHQFFHLGDIFEVCQRLDENRLLLPEFGGCLGDCRLRSRLGSGGVHGLSSEVLSYKVNKLSGSRLLM